ncbi:helix-turn-helix transcriptional regulator [Pseudomonas sp. FSL R10-0071]|uniref:helix-turn-helix transcriptional regulator n=1 Tax=Pseudomonas sp. FSL R10-0071 TaxID=2662193 RepID=UPI0035326B26
MDSIADALKVSKRTLQYSLRNEGLSFSMVYNDVRQALAHDYLRHSVYSIKYISATLGFSDQSSFYKASLRWFGMTPQYYRDLS